MMPPSSSHGLSSSQNANTDNAPHSYFPHDVVHQKRKKPNANRISSPRPPSSCHTAAKTKHGLPQSTSGGGNTLFFFRVHYLGHEEMGSLFSPLISSPLLERKHERPILPLSSGLPLRQSGKKCRICQEKKLFCTKYLLLNGKF